MIEFLMNPVAQDPAYHAFADPRDLLGIPNFWNVVSNLTFLAAGWAGLVETARHRADPLHLAWFTFFAGILLTALGSAWYHLAPDNESLAWDRLAMTVGFSGFVAIIVGEYASIAWPRRLLVPLLLAGIASVGYWIVTEQSGDGDLRAYALIQFLPLLAIPALVWVRRERSSLSPWVGAMLALYALAKLVEHYDAAIYGAGQLLSGHTLKHFAAALGAAALLAGLRRKRRTRPPVTQIPE